MYLVTGATGNVGSNVVRRLLAAGEKVRVFTRDPRKLEALGGQVDVAAGSYEDAASFARALEGAEAMYLVNGRSNPSAFSALIAAARVAGGARVVFQSTILAGDPASSTGQFHQRQENVIREAGLNGRFIRPSAFMSNSLQWRSSIKAEGAVYHAMGSGRFAPIAPEDIAAVGVKALTMPELAGDIWEITGAELVTVGEQVATLGAVLGRRLRSVEVSLDLAAEKMIRAGVPGPMVRAALLSQDRIRAGRAAQVTDTFRQLTGISPMPFRSWVQAHAAEFR